MAKTAKQANQPMTNKMRRRLNRWVAFFFVILVLYIVFNLINASIIKADFYKDYATKQQMSSQTINANRGTIYSANMEPLAQSATVWSVVLAPSIVVNNEAYVEIAQVPAEQKEALAINLATALGLSDHNTILKKFDTEHRFVRVHSTTLNEKQIKKVQALIDAGTYPYLMFAKEAVAKGLADILELDYNEVLEKTYKNNQYEIIKKKIEKPAADAVQTFITDHKFTYITLLEDSKRYYRNNELASNVLGFTGIDNQGLYGLEAQYDEILQGTNGKYMTATDANGNPLPTSKETKRDPINGNSIVLTLDEYIQRLAQKKVDEIYKLHKPTGGVQAIVMDVKTGGILAMASSANYNPNKPNEIYSEELKNIYNQSVTVDSQGNEITDLSEKELKDLKSELRNQQWGNKLINMLYEPGSTFKIVTASAALETGAATTESHYSCGGGLQVGPEFMRCHKRDGHGALDFKGAIVNSCNPAFMSMGLSMGAHNFSEYFRLFGLQSATGIDLPGEAPKSLYISEDKMGQVELASSAFGQTVTITPIQLITSVATAVNGGYLVQPHFLKEVLDQNDNVIETNNPEVKRQVVSQETSEILRDCLEAMVEKSSAYVKGYRIGGKSGTSQKGNKSENGRISSFVTFAPANDPQIATLIIADDPTTGAYYGSVVCGPSAGELTAEALSYLGVAPEYSQEDLEQMSVPVPNVVGNDLVTAKTSIAGKQLQIRIVGEGEKVVDQMPKGGSMASGGQVIVYTEKNSEQETVTVPNVIGMSPQDANLTLTNAGLNVSLDGNSAEGAVQVISQSHGEGAVVPAGTIVTIKYAVGMED